MMVTAVLAATCAGGAVAAALWPSGRPPVARARPRDERRSRRLLAGAVGGALLAMPLWLHGRQLAVTIIGLATALAVGQLVDRSRRNRAAEARSDRVLAACEALAGDLAAGEPPSRALARMAHEWPELARAARAAELGADVPSALRALATAPGAGQLTVVAAAWQVAHESGGRLAPAVSRAARGVAEQRTVRRLLRAELASAHATARLLAALPLVMVLMGRGIGADPVHFLVATPVGLGCLAAGLLLSYLGVLWLDRIAAGVLR